jgi:hypothetical protein
MVHRSQLNTGTTSRSGHLGIHIIRHKARVAGKQTSANMKHSLASVNWKEPR